MIQTITEGGGGGRTGYGYGRSYSGGGDFAFAMKDSFSGYGSYLYVSAGDVCVVLQSVHPFVTLWFSVCACS